MTGTTQDSVTHTFADLPAGASQRILTAPETGQRSDPRMVRVVRPSRLASHPGVSYRPHLESGALRQMHGPPDHAFDMLVTLLARVCDDPCDPVSSAPTGMPRRRTAWSPSPYASPQEQSVVIGRERR